MANKNKKSFNIDPALQEEDEQTPPAENKMLAEKKVNPIDELYLGMVEQTYKRSGYVYESQKMPYNPDDLYQKKGNYSIYEAMMQDDQVSICSNLKKDLVLGSGYSLVPTDEAQSDMCEELQENLEQSSDMPFIDKLREVLDAYEKGFSLTEKVFMQNPDGTIGLKDLLTRHPNSFLIYQDDKGTITKILQKSTAEGDIEINPKSLIHYINNGQYQNPYGRSDLRAAYNAWFVKCQVVRFFGIFLESTAKPIPVAKYDINAPAGTADELLAILKNFQAKTALAIPKQVEIDFLESKSAGDAYHKALNIFNMFIGRSMFIPDLLGMSGSETSGGSLALGKEQMNIFFMHINRRRATLEKYVQRHIVNPMWMYNYGDIKPPKFKFNPLNDNEAVDLAKVWLDLVKTKVAKVNPEEINYFRSLVKFPEGDVEMIDSAPSVLGPDGQPLDPNDINHPSNPLNPKSPLNPANKQDAADPNAAENKDDKTQLPDAGDNKKKSFAKIYNLPPGTYHKKVDFKAIATKLNDYDNSIKNETKPIVDRMYNAFFDQLKSKNILNNQNIGKIDSINLKYKGELKKVLRDSFMALYKDAKTQAARELDKTDYAAPLPADEFLDLLDQEIYAYIGKYEYTIKEKAKTEIIAALKDGEPLSSVISILRDDGKNLSEVSLERYARTKHTEVMNRARKDYFDDSGVVAGYQYSAILDDRTSEICAGLDGKIFTKDDAPVPPLHFNCRSLLIPITKYETFTPSEKVGKMDIQDFIEENKGDGFATN